MSVHYYIALDGDNEPTLWREEPDRLPEAILRRCDLPRAARPLWTRLTSDPAVIWERGRAAGADLFPARPEDNPYREIQ